VNLPSWLSNAYRNYFQQTQNANNKPYQQYGGPTVAGPTGNQQNALALAQLADDPSSWQRPLDRWVSSGPASDGRFN